MDLEVLDDNINMMLAKFELTDEPCHLKHSDEDPAENHPAVDYLCQGLGDQKTGEITSQIRIPVCVECINALKDNDWILCYCTYCNKSQWIYRPLAKREYPDGNLVYYMDICPFCAVVEDEYGKEA